MTVWTATLLFGGGVVAGIINAMAGGGSLLTVPLLSLAGVGGLTANGTNRIAVLLQNVSSGYGYARRGVVPWQSVTAVVVPAAVGGLIGSALVSQLADDTFERLFGLLMLPLLALSMWRPPRSANSSGWPRWVVALVFGAVGFYAGSIQAGAGLIILLVLNRAGYDLVVANALKTTVILVVTAIAVPVFLLQGQVRFGPAVILAVGMMLGGYVGSQIAVDGGERVIRPVLVVSVLALAGRMLGLYG